MRVWNRHPDEVLLVDAVSGESVTAGQVERDAAGLSARGIGLAFLFAEQTVQSITRFLALVESGIPVVMLDARMSPGMVGDLLQRYRPEAVFLPDRATDLIALLPDGELSEQGVWSAPGPGGPKAHPDLSVLLSTSGSTGSPKLVRLSLRNVLSNARAIAESLRLRPEDRAVTSLPPFYSFGMSLITSHVIAGSSVVVSAHSVMDREFWGQIDEYGVTHLAGVPQTYSMLRRLRFTQRELPSLRALLQAGGRLAPEIIAEFSEDCDAKGRQFFVMYGQTEASPRMACMPPERLADKIGSVGVALSGGRFSIIGAGGATVGPGDVGEIVYSGPNVMMGYAQSRGDLARGDDLGGTLNTGDLGYLDDEGFLYVTGRTKRIAKVSGVRVSLDEVEAMLSNISPVAAVAAGDDGIAVFTAHPDAEAVSVARKRLARDMGAALALITVHRVDELPLMPSGKVDYSALNARAARVDR